MRQPVFTSKFKRDLRRQNRRGKSRGKIETLIEVICIAGDAPPGYRPHNLTGNWLGCRECHIESDWLIIYAVKDIEVLFYRTGSHSDLF